MPGVIAAVGVEDGESSVRRGARPLLRRPWQTLALAAPAEDVTLAFAGERGGVHVEPTTGVVAAFDGELLPAGAAPVGAEAARVLVDLYGAAGEDLDPPDGSFACVLWDPRREQLVLVTDRFGRRPLYTGRSGGGALLVAGELKALVAMGLRPELDLDAWAQILAYEHALGEFTPLAGVRRVPGGTTLVLRKDGGELRRERWRYRLQPDGRTDERELVEELGRLLVGAVRPRLEADTALALSGGLDSRCLATAVSALRPGASAVTYGVAGSTDFRVGAAVAALAGLEHTALPLEPGYIGRGAATTVWLTEGHVRCLHAHLLVAQSLRERLGLASALIGLAGDTVLRGLRPPPAASEEEYLARRHAAAATCLTDDLLEALLTPGFADQLRGRARASFVQALGEEEGDRFARRNQFAYRHVLARMQWAQAGLLEDVVTPRDPFDDAALVDFCRRLPEQLRLNGRLQAAYLRRHPALASLPAGTLGTRPSLTGRRARAAAFRTRASSRVSDALSGLVGARLFPDRRVFGDYRHDLCSHGAGLLQTLLEPRTIARGQLRAEPVRQLVEATLRGRGRHTYALGVLLTLELFQRQFLDGDGAPES